MAQKVSATYHPLAKVKCINCGSTFSYGSTIENLTVEVCGNCHPFYTGQDSILDTAGRIEKFQARLKLVQGPTYKSKKVKTRKVLQNLADLETSGS